MRERVSQRAVDLRVEWLNKALGRPIKPAWGERMDPDKAAFYVDHQLGGYRLECAGSPIFGHSRMSKGALVDQIEAILVTIKLARGEVSGAAWPMKAPDGSMIRSEGVEA